MVEKHYIYIRVRIQFASSVTADSNNSAFISDGDVPGFLKFIQFMVVKFCYYPVCETGDAGDNIQTGGAILMKVMYFLALL